MNFYILLSIALALSLDAFGVAICIGLNNQVRRNHKFVFAASFAFFQFLFSLIGAYTGFLFNKYIASVPQLIGGIIIAIVGCMMIKEGIESKGECPLIKPSMYFVLGISVSIDAMVIGFTALSNINNILAILSDTIVIGFVTLVMSLAAFFLSRYLKKINAVGKYADYLGGVILILFGIKMILF